MNDGKQTAARAVILFGHGARDPAWARAVMTAHICNARAVMVRAATDKTARPATSPDPQEEEAS